MRFLEIPFFRQLNAAENILIAGAGGGFDIFSGLPLYFALREEGRQVHLASLSFSNLHQTEGGAWLGSHLLEVTADTVGNRVYFPEGQLARWFRQRGEEVSIYGFDRAGVRQLAESYRWLVEHLGIDTVILADGGTDSLMRGDEVDLGTPEADVSSLLAVQELSLPRKMLACLGFGVDTFHGVCHALVLENISALIRSDAFLGAFSLTADMPAVKAYREATEAVLAATHRRFASIVCTSVLAALDGRFGDHHATRRTQGSELFINPLMSQFWCFDVDGVVQRLLYAEQVRATTSLEELALAIGKFRAGLSTRRPWRELPI